MAETLSESSARRSIPNANENISKTNYRPGVELNSGKFMAKTDPLAEDENNNSEQTNDCHQVLKAVEFKYTNNASPKEIHEIRKLLSAQRAERLLDEDAWRFFKSDYERMMVDDWLVTRFLLRGKKAILSHLDQLDAKAAAATMKQQQQRQLNARDRAQLLNQTTYAKTMNLIEVCAKFRYEYRINALTTESEFPIEWTRENGMFKHRQDRAGNPTAYLRVALHRPKLIEGAELRHQFYRYMLYVLEQCDQDLFQRPGKAICCVFDMSNVSFENIDLELTSWMIKSFKSCAPKLLCYVIVYNPPWFFTATFKLICSTLLSNNKRQSIKFAYDNEILDFIDLANLPPYLQERLTHSKR